MATPSRRRRPGKWLVIGAIAVLLVLVIGYVLGGAAAAAGPLQRADSALATTVKDNNSVADMFKNEPFKNVDLGSDNPDTAAAKTALGQVRKQLTSWQSMIANDRKSLQQARDGLNGSLLTLPEKSMLDSRRHRVDAGLAAMKDAQQGSDLLDRQLAFVEPLIDVIAGFEGFSKAADANDLPGMQAQLASADANMQKTIALGKNASLPQQLSSGLGALQKTINDLRALVSAA
jgi:hypothetical protein